MMKCPKEKLGNTITSHGPKEDLRNTRKNDV